MITIKQVSATILKNLKPRFRDVVEKRFGLKVVEALTLESIGKQYKVSRERIRQIEASALRELHKNLGSAQDVFVLAKKELAGHMGAMNEVSLAEHITNQSAKRNGEMVNHVRFLLSLSSDFVPITGDDEWHDAWADSVESVANLKQFVHQYHDALVKKNEPTSDAEAKLMAKNTAEGIYGKNINEATAWELLNISKMFGYNPFGEFGLAEWREINPKSVRDKAYIVLKKSQKPLHFKVIANEINRYARMARSQSFSHHPNWIKNAHPQTAHNELIKDNRFVLVGRGMYGLKSWGYDSGTVREVLVKLLAKAPQPLSKEELYETISKQRIVQANTVFLNLATNKHLFGKLEDGRFVLKQKPKNA